MTEPGITDHRLDASNLAARQWWARHLRSEHGYCTLDTDWPVSESALARIRARAGCQHRRGTVDRTPPAG